MYRTLCFKNANARWNKIHGIHSLWVLYVLVFKLPFSVALLLHRWVQKHALSENVIRVANILHQADAYYAKAIILPYMYLLASTSFLHYYYPAENFTPRRQEMPHLRCLQYFCYRILLRCLNTSSLHSLSMCILW